MLVPHKKFYTLEEVSEILQISIAQLQQWEKQFKAHFLFSVARGKDSYTQNGKPCGSSF